MRDKGVCRHVYKSTLQITLLLPTLRSIQQMVVPCVCMLPASPILSNKDPKFKLPSTL